MILFATVIVIISILYLVYRRYLLSKYGKALEEYNSNAFKDIMEATEDKRFNFVTRLASEVESKKGIKAIFVRSTQGCAIHHINKNGTFSARGPYFVSRSHPNWRVTGRKLLVKVVRGNNGRGFRPDHYDQTGIIEEMGVEILEYDTKKHYCIGIHEFAERCRAEQRKQKLHF